jgi:hypothetical protein
LSTGGERRVRVGLVEQVDGELDRPALRRPDGGAPERGEDLERAAVVGQDRRREALDALLTGAREQVGEQDRAQPAPLAAVGHRHGHLGGVRVLEPHEAGDPEPLAVLLGQRDEGLVIVVVGPGSGT